MADYELDTTGLRCPEPVMMLHRQIRSMNVGEVVRVLASDPATRRDIPQFCEFLSHDLLEQGEQDDQFWYRVRKSGR